MKQTLSHNRTAPIDATAFGPKTLRRVLGLAALILVAASVSGCSKCGFIWDEGRSNACRSDTLPK
jgi:hypothetical protein